MSAHHPSLKDQVAAALDWWRDAGVDYDFSDDATDWLAQPTVTQDTKPNVAAPQAPQLPEVPAEPAIKELLTEPLPQDLSAFHEFWLNAPQLSVAGNAARIAPKGESGAELMILVMTPEQSDTDQLLSGAQGNLLAKILAAMQLEKDQVYFASCVPQALPMADGEELRKAGFAQVLSHHIKLAKPKRILAFGTNILPLLGHTAAHQPETVQEFAAEDSSIPLLVTEGLEALSGMPRLKARFWRRWLAHITG